MSQPDRLSTTASAARLAGTPARIAPAAPIARPARIAGDTRLVMRPAPPAPPASKAPADAPEAPGAEPELLAPPKEAKGWVRTLWNLMFGNTENKWFQIKVNLVHYKDVVLGVMQALQSGPLSPLFTVVDKVGALFAGTTARLRGVGVTAESGLGARALAALGRAASPLTKLGAMAFKWLERGAPLFGILVAVQDLYKAAMLQGDGKVGADRKVFAWATFAFSTVGATASAIAAWSAVGATVAVPLGFATVGLGTIAIACFGLSLLTGWLGARLAKEQAPAPAKA